MALILVQDSSVQEVRHPAILPYKFPLKLSKQNWNQAEDSFLMNGTATGNVSDVQKSPGGFFRSPDNAQRELHFSRLEVL